MHASHSSFGAGVEPLLENAPWAAFVAVWNEWEQFTRQAVDPELHGKEIQWHLKPVAE